MTRVLASPAMSEKSLSVRIDALVSDLAGRG